MMRSMAASLATVNTFWQREASTTDQQFTKATRVRQEMAAQQSIYDA
jgi:hypothetical protein